MDWSVPFVNLEVASSDTFNSSEKDVKAELSALKFEDWLAKVAIVRACKSVDGWVPWFLGLSLRQHCLQRVGAWRSRGIMKTQTVKPLKNLIKNKKYNLSRKTPIAPNPCWQ